jgi:hypothetical protein
LGQRNGLDRRSEEAGRERVVLARCVDVGEGAVGEQAEAEVEAWAESGWYEGCAGDATRELEGVLAGVVELELYKRVGGTQL